MIAPASARRRFLILHNPAAGRNGIKLARAVADELRKRGAEVAFVELENGAEPDLSTAADYDAVVISGGDGTIRAIAEKLSPVRIPIGVIPNGTGNVLAEELELPRTAAGISDLLMHGPAHPIRGGLINGMLFLLMVGAGFDGDVINELSRTWVQLFGKLAYAAPIVRALLRKPRLFDVAIDGQVVRASWVLVSNVSRYAGRFRLSPRLDGRDPALLALLSRATTRRQRFTELLRLLAGHFSAAPTVEMKDVTHAEVSDTTTPAQCDGESLPPGPYVICRREHDTLFIAPERRR